MSQSALRGQVDRLGALVDRLEGFEQGVSEEMRRGWGGQTQPPEHPPGVTCDPQCTLNAVGLCRLNRVDP